MIDLIKLQIKVKSRNKLDRMHWGAKKRDRQIYELLIRNKMTLGKIAPADIGAVYGLAINCYLPRLYDYDNLVGGCKHLIDALTRERFIWDDSVKFIGVPVINQHKSKEEFVIIERFM